MGPPTIQTQWSYLEVGGPHVDKLREVKMNARLPVFPASNMSVPGTWVGSRGGTIPEITMRYVSRYLSHNTIRITILR